MAAGEVVLMYHLEGDRGRKLKTIFVQNGLRIRQIPREEYNQPIGALAGIKEIPRVEEVYDGDKAGRGNAGFPGGLWQAAGSFAGADAQEQSGGESESDPNRTQCGVERPAALPRN